ncbi:MAG: DNA polymerase IV [Anaerolineae bacterium]|jgi:DNA polymerase-4|nr:DNA polymerase IV [Anaerolineae bacterium]
MNGGKEQPRKILHLDLDAFFCAVEEQHDPDLQGKPFAVGGSPDQRGVVASCSYAARLFGIHSAMPMSRALQLYPDLIIVHSHHGVYGEVSQQVMAHLYNLTSLVEQVSIDEAFLDVSDLRPSAETLARQLQAAIWEELTLPCSLGVATNKLIAKIANNIGKGTAQKGKPPMSIRVVPPGEEAAFLDPLPVQELWGVGPKTAAHLEALGIRTIGDLARWPENDLVRRFGKLGGELAMHARGIDERPVVTEHETKSVSKETTFSRDVSDKAVLCRTLRKLTEGVGKELRRNALCGTTVRLKLRWQDFTTITRQVSLLQPTNQDAEIYQEASTLFEKAWPPDTPVRLIGVGVSDLSEPVQQLGLWETPSEKGQRLQETLDTLRERFGDEAVRRASELIDEDSE